jgi:hypothetical protein
MECCLNSSERGIFSRILRLPIKSSYRKKLNALVHNAGKMKFGAEKRGKKEKCVFEQLDTLEFAANGSGEHI